MSGNEQKFTVIKTFGCSKRLCVNLDEGEYAEINDKHLSEGEGEVWVRVGRTVKRFDGGKLRVAIGIVTASEEELDRGRINTKKGVWYRKPKDCSRLFFKNVSVGGNRLVSFDGPHWVAN